MARQVPAAREAGSRSARVGGEVWRSVAGRCRDSVSRKSTIWATWVPDGWFGLEYLLDEMQRLHATMPSLEGVHVVLDTERLRFNVVSFVIDAMPETREAHKLVKKFRRGVAWRCVYEYHGLREARRDWGEYMVKADRTISLDISHAKFVNQEISLPRDFMKHYKGDVVAHMCAPCRMKETRANGSEVYVWNEKGHADHWRHASNYAAIAQQIHVPPPIGMKV